MAQIFIKEGERVIGSFDPNSVYSTVVYKSGAENKVNLTVKTNYGETEYIVSEQAVVEMFKEYAKYVKNTAYLER